LPSYQYVDFIALLKGSTVCRKDRWGKQHNGVPSLSTARTFIFFQFHTGLLFKAAAFTLLATTPFAFAQNKEVSGATQSAVPNDEVASSSSLPDAPSSSLFDQNQQIPIEPQPGQPAKTVKPPEAERGLFGLGYSDSYRASHEASPTDKYILPGQLAPKLTTGDKVELGFIHGISAYATLGWIVSAGYSQIIDTTPNYGVDKGAYGERLGAAALRGYSDEVLRDSLMANVFHQDPRYYKMGPRHNVATRTLYAVSRVVVTRGDDGRLAPNYSMIAGNAVGAGLTNAYYPDVNRGFHQTAKTFEASMYGSAFSFFAAEFLSGALEAVHLKASH
jgi:hypothetical protein